MDDILVGAYSGFVLLFTWQVFPFLILGILIGMFLGLVPGLSGLVGLALLLPFSIGQPPEVAFAFLLGMYAVTTQTDTIPAVLLGVPGTSAATATMLDGYPMAKRGEAGRALSASYFASIFGTVVAAIAFLVALPLLRELISAFGAPEFFMLTMLGLVMAGSLSGGSVARGIAMSGFGLTLSIVGLAPVSGEERFVPFGLIYFWDGIPLVPFVLGFFAIPEVVDLAVQNTSIAQGRTDQRGQAARDILAGFRDTVEHWWLIVRCGTIGTVCGIIPGMGGPVAEWFAYGHAVSSAKDSSRFGNGDVRGVIAPEAGTAAQKPGALLPTIAFSIPGNAAMALLLGAFIIVGLRPGPEMVTTKLDITFLMVWTVVVSNIIAAVFALGLQRYLVLLCYVRPAVLVPMVLAFMTVGATLATRDIADVLLFGGAGLLGYVLKHANWPRVPLILGLVLGHIGEPELYHAITRYGADWLWQRPAVVVLLALMALSIASPVYRRYLRRRTGRPTAEGAPAGRRLPATRSPYWWLDVVALTLGVSITIGGLAIPILSDKVLPTIAGVAVVLAAMLTVVAGAIKGIAPMTTPSDGVAPAVPLAERVPELLTAFLWIAVLLAGVLLLGLKVAAPVFVFAYMTAKREKLLTSAFATAVVAIFIELVLYRLLHIQFPGPILFDWPGF